MELVSVGLMIVRRSRRTELRTHDTASLGITDIDATSFLSKMQGHAATTQSVRTALDRGVRRLWQDVLELSLERYL